MYYADYLGGSCLGSAETATFPPMEVRHVGSHVTAADVVERRAQLSEVLSNNMADALSRMLADTLECDEARVQFNTHLEQLASHLVNEAAHQVEPAERPPRTRPPQPWRPLTHSLVPTTMSTASPAHATVSRERLNSWLQARTVPRDT